MVEKFYTTDQVAKILQVHPFTILKYIKVGKLNGIKLGRIYRMTESDINEFLENQSTKKTKKKAEKKVVKKVKKKESAPKVQFPIEEMEDLETAAVVQEETFKLEHLNNSQKELDERTENTATKKIPGGQEPDHYYII